MDRKSNVDEMRILDWFAGVALIGILARNTPDQTMADQAIEAFEMAGEMISQGRG